MSTKVVIPRSRIGLRLAGIAMTPEEFDALPPHRFDDRYRYELIRGVLVVSPYPRAGERDPNEELGHILRTYQETHPQGAALDTTLPEHTIATATNRRRPDRAIWAGLGRVPEEEKDLPTIIVEFVSASRRDFRRDYEEKRDEYLAAGVREYWVIDRFQRTLTVYRNRANGPETLVVREKETYQTELLPGFILPLARLLAKADNWPPRKRARRSSSGGTDG